MSRAESAQSLGEAFQEFSAGYPLGRQSTWRFRQIRHIPYLKQSAHSPVSQAASTRIDKKRGAGIDSQENCGRALISYSVRTIMIVVFLEPPTLPVFGSRPIWPVKARQLQSLVQPALRRI
jgi:hypothetical protein